MNADGSGVQQLTSTPDNESSPRWQPQPTVGVNGAKIAYARVPVSDPNAGDIWLMQADGTQQIRLTTAAATDEAPRWNANGTRLGFTSRRDGNLNHIGLTPTAPVSATLKSSV
jgi:TolB protein